VTVVAVAFARLTLLACVLTMAIGCGGGGGDEPESGAASPTEPPPTAEAVRDPLLWGAWIDRHRTGTLPPWDMTAVDRFEKIAGKRMSLIHFGTPFADHAGTQPYAFPAQQFAAIRAHGAMPLFSWAAQPLRAVHDPDFTLAAIAAGRQDDYLRTWATAAKAWGMPFLLRLGWEMNGDWFPWAPKFDDAPASTFVKAWRHVHDVFRAAGADNVRWVWCPVTDPEHVEQPLAPLYPGAAYVDWTCLDGYNRDEPWLTAEQLFGPSYDEITREIAPDKPMLLAEVASTEAGGSKAEWIAGLFDALRTRFPRVRALTWFDKTQPGGTSQHADWPIDSSPASAKAFARAIASPRYAAGKPAG
jgi:hypothetical protein